MDKYAFSLDLVWMKIWRWCEPVSCDGCAFRSGGASLRRPLPILCEYLMEINTTLEKHYNISITSTRDETRPSSSKQTSLQFYLLVNKTASQVLLITYYSRRERRRPVLHPHGNKYNSRKSLQYLDHKYTGRTRIQIKATGPLAQTGKLRCSSTYCRSKYTWYLRKKQTTFIIVFDWVIQSDGSTACTSQHSTSSCGDWWVVVVGGWHANSPCLEKLIGDSATWAYKDNLHRGHECALDVF